MEILFLTGLFPKEKEEEIIKNSIRGVQNAANNLQWEFINGLEQNIGKPITILNSMYIGSYPIRYRKSRVQTFSFSVGLLNSKALNVGFCNVTGYKRLSRYFRLRPFIKEWLLTESKSKKVVIAYAMTSVFTELLEYAKMIDKSIVTCLIVPDLPKYMNLTTQENKLYSILKGIEISMIKRNMEYIDCYVLLTEHMIKALDISKPSMIIEGISTDLSTLSNNDLSYDGKIKTVVYTGGLNIKYGIIELLESFCMLENANYRLILCGSGDAELKIKEYCQIDNRIVFKGLISRLDVISLQSTATLLVNPRENNEDYTKFSFPSKILEYMSSGRPVLAYMLDGMPIEYEKFIYTIKPNRKMAIYHALKEVLEKDNEELSNMGERARDFVLREKNGKKQCEKIVNMLSSM